MPRQSIKNDILLRPTLSGPKIASVALVLAALAGAVASGRSAQGQVRPGAAAKPQNASRLGGQMEKIRLGFPGEMAIYMKNLTTAEEIALDADRVYETYSVIKIPVMVEVLRQARHGDFSLADRIEVKAADKRLGSGILAGLDPGLQPTVRDLLTLMITISDNTATDLLADKVGRPNVTRTMHELGLKHTSIEYSVLDDYRAWYTLIDPTQPLASAEEVYRFPVDKYPREKVDEASWKLNDDPHIYFGHSTAREIGWLLEQMTRGALVSQESSALMLEILKRQRVNDRFPRYVRGVKIAHKTGDDQPRIANDAGVLWVKDQTIVLVVFTAHHKGTTDALHDAIARVAAYTVRQYGGETTTDFKP